MRNCKHSNCSREDGPAKAQQDSKPNQPDSQTQRVDEAFENAIIVSVRVLRAIVMSVTEGLPFLGVLFAVPLDSLDRVGQTAVDRAQLHRGRLPQITCTMCERAALAMPATACRKVTAQFGLGEARIADHGMHILPSNGRVVPWFLHRAPNFGWGCLGTLPDCLPGTARTQRVTVSRPGRRGELLLQPLLLRRGRVSNNSIE